MAENEHGHTGEIPEFLFKLTDFVWITNMIALVEAQIAEPLPVEAGDPNLPF